MGQIFSGLFGRLFGPLGQFSRTSSAKLWGPFKMYQGLFVVLSDLFDIFFGPLEIESASTCTGPDPPTIYVFRGNKCVTSLDLFETSDTKRDEHDSICPHTRYLATTPVIATYRPMRTGLHTVRADKRKIKSILLFRCPIIVHKEKPSSISKNNVRMPGDGGQKKTL